MRTVDPIIAAIKAFHDGNEAYRAGTDESVEFADATYGGPLKIIQDWTAPAVTLKGAMAALRFALHECESVGAMDAGGPMLKAAMAYLDQPDSRGMNRKIELEDALGEATSFVRAIRMCADNMDNEVGCAIDVIAEQIALRLNQARNIIDDIGKGGDA